MIGKCSLLQINKIVMWKSKITVTDYGSLKFGGFINCFNSPPRVLLQFPHMLGLASLQHCLLFEELSVEKW
jgi:hypothetical protein